MDELRTHVRYLGYLADLVCSLAPGGMLVVDNVMVHAHELTDFTASVEADKRLTQTPPPG